MAPFSTAFTSRVGIEHPIVQAPMAGGATTPELVAAVSNVGALGSLAAATLSPDAIVETVGRIRALTAKPFNVNLLVVEPPRPTQAQLARAREFLAPIRAELGLDAAPALGRTGERFEDRAQVLLELSPAVVSFAFGLPPKQWIERLRKKGVFSIGTATTVAEAKAWVDIGIDCVCAQGAEAGAHRATFLGDYEQSCVGLMALVPQVAAAVRCPVIASGGIMNGRGIAAALILGAHAAQLGTAFLSCPEADIDPTWRRKLLEGRDDNTRLTRAFTGRYARAIVNDYMERLRAHEAEFPGFPVQNALTADIRQSASAARRSEFMPLWAGQGAAMSRPMPAGALVNTLAEELQQAMLAPLKHPQ